MLFACSQCKTRYTIADEKVVDKTLKISCESCGAVIVLRGPPRTEPPEMVGSKTMVDTLPSFLVAEWGESDEGLRAEDATGAAMPAPSDTGPWPAPWEESAVIRAKVLEREAREEELGLPPIPELARPKSHDEPFDMATDTVEEPAPRIGEERVLLKIPKAVREDPSVLTGPVPKQETQNRSGEHGVGPEILDLGEVVAQKRGTGPQAAPSAGSGQHKLPGTRGSGQHKLPGGSGAHALPGGSGAHVLPQSGSPGWPLWVWVAVFAGVIAITWLAATQLSKRQAEAVGPPALEAACAGGDRCASAVAACEAGEGAMCVEAGKLLESKSALMQAELAYGIGCDGEHAEACEELARLLDDRAGRAHKAACALGVQASCKR